MEIKRIKNILKLYLKMPYKNIFKKQQFTEKAPGFLTYLTLLFLFYLKQESVKGYVLILIQLLGMRWQ